MRPVTADYDDWSGRRRFEWSLAKGASFAAEAREP
jgi:hypothetical protein